jgi:hypothetical protein
MANYKDVSLNRRSEVWQHFLWSDLKQKAKCRLCNVEMEAKGTSGMSGHLNSQHQISITKCVSSTVTPVPNPRKYRRMDQFLSSGGLGKKTVQEVVSRLAAEDGLSFNKICTSQNLRGAFGAQGFILPRCRQTARKYVMDYCAEVKKSVKEEFKTSKEAGSRFSITFDEYTSLANSRFMNLNVHFQSGFQSLGMIHVKGTMPATKGVELVTAKLESFSLNLDTDIVASCTDGASVMQKFGRITKPLHMMCYAHAIHLSVCDLFVTKKKKQTAQVDSENNDSGSDAESDQEFDSDEEGDQGFEVNPAVENEVTFIEEFQSIIAKIRKYIKLFKRSPVKNDDNLQPKIFEQFGKLKMLILDSKTRWNSTVVMLRRFIEVQKEVRLAMVELDLPFELTTTDLEKIKSLCDALEPLKIAVEALGREDADLLLSEKIIEFTRKKLEDANTEISLSIKDQFEIRIEQRRNVTIIHLFKYLESPTFLTFQTDQFGHKITRTKIVSQAANLLQRLYTDGARNDMETEVCTEEEDAETLSLADELQQFISKPVPLEAVNVGSQAEKIVKKEMALFEATNNRPENLQKLFDALKTIPPTSIEAERAFSAVGIFITKLRNKLSPSTIDALIFLKYHFKNRGVLRDT